MLHTILWAVAVIWGFSGCATVIIFGLDARAFRRRTRGQTARPGPVVNRPAERGITFPTSATA